MDKKKDKNKAISKSKKSKITKTKRSKCINFKLIASEILEWLVKIIVTIIINIILSQKK